MNIAEAIYARHSVRAFTDKKIDEDTLSALQREIEDCNAKSGLSIQLLADEPKAFDGMKAHYGRFRDCKNYFAIVGEKGSEESCGYYGERLVLFAQTLGLNTCWVALSYSKNQVPCKIGDGQKLLIVIALGYGVTQGVAHNSKPIEKLCRADGETPDWFKAGMEAAMLAPTAINQQQFFITLKGNAVKAVAKLGFYAKVDLGIIKYHFEVGAYGADWHWAD